jgi:hypothetical protein
LQIPAVTNAAAIVSAAPDVAPFIPTAEANPVGLIPMYSAIRCGRNEVDTVIRPSMSSRLNPASSIASAAA